ncbi:MAG: helix-turn-helix domain-containing protein [Oscillospiraceae bacterium]|nr:helix-turn-helix domain-containing protein [Oscillospiraceae bacterium]
MSTKTMFTLENCLKEYPMLLTTKQVAGVLRLGRNSTFKLLHSGKIRIVRCGRLLYTPKPAIIDFLNGVKSTTKDLDLSADTCYSIGGEQREKEDVAK